MNPDRPDDEAGAGERPDEEFVRRWSRRKHADAEREADRAPADARPPESDPDHASGGEPPTAGDVPPTDADMPPLETLGADSDYSGFLSPRVSESLRRAALRRLFGTPGFNVRDGLDDYDDDYTNFTALGDTLTSDMKHRAERAAARAAKADARTGDGEAGTAADNEHTPSSASTAEAGSGNESVASDARGQEDDPDERS